MKEVQTTHESLKLGQGVNSVNLKPEGFALTKSTFSTKPNKQVSSEFFVTSTLREMQSTLEGTLGVSGPNSVGSINMGLTDIKKSQW